MKQLLDTTDSGIVVGIGSSAFLVTNQNKFDQTRVCQLLPPNQREVKDGNKDPCDVQDATEIQAVAILKNNTQSITWCAVSRMNKTLSLYRVTNERNELHPAAVHKMSKRACCIAFAQVPSSRGKSGDLHVVIAGDLTGDASAFPLTISMQDSEAEDLENNDASLERKGRLLLGHTASVLTSVKVVTRGAKTLVLTSDRDEKIRISCFPQTQVIEGYLFGHTAFVSCMDVATESDDALCVTCAGDGAIHLWNYESYQLLSLVSTPISNVESGEEGQSTPENKAKYFIPTNICISPDGNSVAVIFDDCKNLKVLQVTPAKELRERQIISCPSQPLGVRFWGNSRLFVLAREPEYCICFELQTSHTVNSYGKPWKIARDNSTCQALMRVASGMDVRTPSSLLETDQWGKSRLRLKEKGGSADEKAWNNVERVKIAKEANARRKKRKREENAAIGTQGD